MADVPRIRSRVQGFRASVPYNRFRRQRVRLVVADRLAETLRPGINVAEERGVVSVRRVKVSGEL